MQTKVAADKRKSKYNFNFVNVSLIVLISWNLTYKRYLGYLIMKFFGLMEYNNRHENIAMEIKQFLIPETNTMHKIMFYLPTFFSSCVKLIQLMYFKCIQLN